MEQLNHFAETNADDALKSAISRYAESKFSARTNLEDEIIKMPICARAPLLALYFIKVRGGNQKSDKQSDKKAAKPVNFEVLVRLFQIAVRIYERHVLYGASNRFIGTDRFCSKSVKQLISNIGKKIQLQSSGEFPEVDNNPYYKEVMFDLMQRLPCFHVGAMLRDYCAMKVMQFVALYAQDVQTLYSVRSNVSICEEQLYKQNWNKAKLLTAKSVIFENDLETENFADFFESYSLR